MSDSKKSKSAKKAVIYTRVSTEEQAVKGNSLVDQEDVLRKACKRDGVEIIEHIQDDGYSAKTFKLPSFQQFLTNLKKGQIKVDFLYVVRWDRFSRNLENTIIMRCELKKYGVTIKCLEETLDDSDPCAVLLSAIKMAEPEMDNRRRAKNTQMGIRRALKEGRYACGAAPVGYSWDRSGMRPMIKPNADANLVKEAYELYATGLYSIESVRKIVQEKGLNIQKTAFNRMLRNPIYRGNIVVPELWNEEEQEVLCIHEAIVSRELFDKVQTILTKIFEKNAHVQKK